jgi:hypothetical protein
MTIDIVLVVIFGLLSVGMVLVLYGTIAQNRWGINVGPVSCPRCNTPFPPHRHPQDTRQALWGGGTCANCGTEVDKWGRELSWQRRRHLLGDVQPEGQLRRVVKRRLIVHTAAGFFCLALLFGWLGIGNHPSTVGEWVAFAGVAAVEAAIFTVLFYVTSMYLLNRFLFRERKPSGAQEQGRE